MAVGSGLLRLLKRSAAALKARSIRDFRASTDARLVVPVPQRRLLAHLLCAIDQSCHGVTKNGSFADAFKQSIRKLSEGTGKASLDSSVTNQLGA